MYFKNDACPIEAAADIQVPNAFGYVYGLNFLLIY